MAEAKTNHRRASAQAGFTLIELLVVLVILGLLAASRARGSSATWAGQVGHGQAPDRQPEVVARPLPPRYRRLPVEPAGPGGAAEEPWQRARLEGPYIDSPNVPQDPWNNPYVYRSPGEHGPYDLYSLGADKAPGGTGENADVTSWGS